MNIHHYNATTKVFKRTTTGITGHGTPANATTVAVPTIPSGQEAVFNETDNTWSLRTIAPIPASSSNPLTDFDNMTIAQKLEHYGLGELISHVVDNNTIAKKVTVDAQIANLQTQITSAVNDITSMGTTNAVVTQNQQLIQELAEDIAQVTNHLLLES